MHDRRYRVYKIHLTDDDAGVDVDYLEASGIRNTFASFRAISRSRVFRDRGTRARPTPEAKIFFGASAHRCQSWYSIYQVPSSGVASNSVVTFAVFGICHPNLITLPWLRRQDLVAGSRSGIPNTESMRAPGHRPVFGISNAPPALWPPRSGSRENPVSSISDLPWIRMSSTSSTVKNFSGKILELF